MPVSPLEINDTLLRDWPLPQPHAQGDKEERGRILIVGGSPEMPGTVILAAIAALRAGAGKVQIATCASIAPVVAGAVMEGRVFAMPETAAGGIASAAAEALIERARQADAVLIGPGLIDKQSTAVLLEHLLRDLDGMPMALDAGALTSLNEARHEDVPLGENIVITPHAGEMASLLQCEQAEIARDPVEAILKASEKFKTNIVLKGAETLLAVQGGPLYRHRAENVGLATGGSGDALAGLMGGLLARGASPPQAAAWAVYVHARAGERLARRIGPLGFLARELLSEFPSLLAELENARPC
jgi:ADP-dependent NAD(P)H-hydrate dehydratase